MWFCERLREYVEQDDWLLVEGKREKSVAFGMFRLVRTRVRHVSNQLLQSQMKEKQSALCTFPLFI